MKAPKGFGKRYFTLAAILAYSVQNRVQSITKIIYLSKKESFEKEEKTISETDPPLDVLSSFIISNSKPCHCSHFDKLKTILSLKIYTFIPRCPYYTTYFAFRRTGIHPPILSTN